MPDRPSLFGSLLRWELVRLARRRQVSRNRILFLYLLLLTVGLFGVWWSLPGNPIRWFRNLSESLSLKQTVVDPLSLTWFTESLALVLMQTQLLFVVLFTPAYATLAVSEEKDKQTLPLLLTTELTELEIVWGKAISRTILMFSAIAAGIPFLVLCWLLGSITFESIVAGYLLSFGTMVLSTSIGVSAACRFPDTRTALVRAYLQMLLFVVVVPGLFKLSPFQILAWEFGIEGPFHLKLDSTVGRLGVGFGYTFLQVGIGVVLLIRATRDLRKREPTAGAPTPTSYPEPPRGRPTPIVLSARVPKPRPLPPLTVSSPVLWFERHVARTRPLPLLDAPAQWLGGMLALIAAFLFIVGAWKLLHRAVVGLDLENAHVYNQQRIERPVGGWMLAAGELTAALFLAPMAVGIAGCVAAERQRKTLDSLLLTPIPRRSILWSKVRAHIERSLGFGVASIAAFGCEFGAFGGVKCGLAAMAAVTSGFWFAIAYGSWLSVHCPTPGRAFWLCLLHVIGAIALPFVAWTFIDWSNQAPAISALTWVTAILTVSGFLAWWRAVAELNRGE